MLKSLTKGTAEKDSLRTALKCLHFTPDHVEVTDGHMLLRKPVPDSFDAGTFLVNTHDNKIDFDLSDIDVDRSKDNGSLVLNSGEIIPKQSESYPDTDSVMPEYDKPKFTIGLDLKVLKKFIDATGTALGNSKESSHFKFEFDSAISAVKITQIDHGGKESSGMYGLIMPVRLAK